MSKELLGQLAKDAVTGSDDIYTTFKYYVEEIGGVCEDEEYDKHRALELIMACVIGGEGDPVVELGKILGFTVVMPEEAPNEDKTMEEERAENYNESAQQ
jgi:hypothetical protein